MNFSIFQKDDHFWASEWFILLSVPKRIPDLPYVFGQTDLSKQCRPRWDAAVRGVSSGSTLLATHPAILDTTQGSKLFCSHFWTSMVSYWNERIPLVNTVWSSATVCQSTFLPVLFSCIIFPYLHCGYILQWLYTLISVIFLLLPNFCLFVWTSEAEEIWLRFWSNKTIKRPPPT